VPAEILVKLFDRIRGWLAALGDGGAAAVEFAIVGSSFMLMLMAAFELGYMLFIQSVLDNSARDAARLIRTGQAQQSANAQTTFSNLLCNDVGALIGCGNIIYASQVFNDWTSAQTAMNTPPTRDVNGNFVPPPFSAGTPTQIVVVTVTYNYPFFTPWVGGLLGGASKSAFMMSTVVFVNEPY
jgi:Flp pilus assembly protein TadG